VPKTPVYFRKLHIKMGSLSTFKCDDLHGRKMSMFDIPVHAESIGIAGYVKNPHLFRSNLSVLKDPRSQTGSYSSPQNQSTSFSHICIRASKLDSFFLRVSASLICLHRTTSYSHRSAIALHCQILISFRQVNPYTISIAEISNTSKSIGRTF
jgi:hypothetical protein